MEGGQLRRCSGCILGCHLLDTLVRYAALMLRFTEKLSRLPEIADLFTGWAAQSLATALAEGARMHAASVGSGGSLATANFLKRCRTTLYQRPTEVTTPMGLTLGSGDLADAQVWIFDAWSDNLDALSAVEAALARRAGRIEVVTRHGRGPAAELALRSTTGRVHIIPVANEEEGYLCTDQMVTSVGALLLASDVASPDPVGPDLLTAFRASVRNVLDSSNRDRVLAEFETIRRNDVVLLAHDPQVTTAACVIETLLWESALCAVQRADLGNLVRSHQTWLRDRPNQSFMLGLTGVDTRKTWCRIDALTPRAIRRTVRDLGNCGRFRNALGVVEALVIVEAIGCAMGVDPDRPGIAAFGHEIYDDDALQAVGQALTPAVRHKRKAVLTRDDPVRSDDDTAAFGRARMEAIRRTAIAGIVLDYDGTVVTTEDRLAPPSTKIMAELERLHACGLRIAFATGRGDSAGKMLREALPADMHADITMGYYNGAYILPLDMPLHCQPPADDPAIIAADAWLRTRPELFLRPYKGRYSGVQIAVPADSLSSAASFSSAVRDCPPIASGDLRVEYSAHSVDIIVARASKSEIVARLAMYGKVLRIGDSGARGGNDNAMLSSPLGVSVGEVCSRHDGCWTLFGSHVVGPEALLQLLRALKPGDDGRFRVDVAALNLRPADVRSEIQFKLFKEIV